MFRVKSIKIQMYGGIIGGSALLYIAMEAFDIANKYSKSGYYYWSKDVRNVTAATNNLGIFLLLVGAVLLGLGIAAAILKNTGKICPGCERVFTRTTAMCPKCRIDLTHAESAKIYLAVKPKIMPKGTPSASNRLPGVWQQSGNKKFCACCGKELSVEVAFCPHCGNKVN